MTKSYLIWGGVIVVVLCAAVVAMQLEYPKQTTAR